MFLPSAWYFIIDFGFHAIEPVASVPPNKSHPLSLSHRCTSRCRPISKRAFTYGADPHKSLIWKLWYLQKMTFSWCVWQLFYLVTQSVKPLNTEVIFPQACTANIVMNQFNPKNILFPLVIKVKIPRQERRTELNPQVDFNLKGRIRPLVRQYTTLWVTVCSCLCNVAEWTHRHCFRSHINHEIDLFWQFLLPLS